MSINYELLWIRLKDIVKTGEIAFEGDIADSDLLRVMEELEADEKF